MEAAGGIQEDDVVAVVPGVADGVPGDLDGVALALLKDREVQLAAHHLQLLDGGGTVDVAADQQGALSELAAHEAAELCRGGGLAGAVEAHHHHHRRGMGGGGQLAGLGAHQGDELLVDDLDDLLGGGQGVQHVAADGPLRDLGHEVLDHFVADVGFQQGKADLPHALLHVRLGEAALAPQALEGLVQFFA